MKSMTTISTKRHYWLRDDFNHLMSLVPANLIKSAHDHRIGSSLTYPKTTAGACYELILRGIDASVPRLNYLIKQRIVMPCRTDRNYGWDQEQIDRAAEHLNQNKLWMPHTHFCQLMNLRFGQCVKAYRVAAARYALPFCFGFDMRNLAACIEPASESDDFARIRFYPRDVSFGFDGKPGMKQEVPA